MVVEDGGALCACGRKGCFEAYASATGLIRMAKEAMAQHPESLLHATAAEVGEVNGRKNCSFRVSCCKTPFGEKIRSPALLFPVNYLVSAFFMQKFVVYCSTMFMMGCCVRVHPAAAHSAYW